MVDFLLHMFVRYYEVKGTRTERVTKSLTSMGSSILLGGFSTFLGVVVLAFSVSFSFQIVFRAFVGMVVLGCSYGLILVPVVLSLVGPEDLVEEKPPETTSFDSNDDDVMILEDDDEEDALSVVSSAPSEISC